MPPPPTVEKLRSLPSVQLGGTDVYRIYRPFAAADSARKDERSPWWFAHVPAGTSADEREAYGRFDLAEPYGTCYFGRSLVGSALEVFVLLESGAVVTTDLQARRAIQVSWPQNGPDPVDLTAKPAHGAGVRGATSTGGRRSDTQAWAEALLDAGWRAIHYAASQDNSLEERSVALFDACGDHPPRSCGGPWDYTVIELLGNKDLIDALAAFGTRVVGPPSKFPLVSLNDSGLLGGSAPL